MYLLIYHNIHSYTIENIILDTKIKKYLNSTQNNKFSPYIHCHITDIIALVGTMGVYYVCCID